MKILLLFLCVWMAIPSFSEAQLPLRGKGEYRWLFFDVYDASLWAPEGEDLFSRPLSLELKYKRSFKGKDIVEQSIKELKSAGSAEPQLSSWRTTMLGIFPDVKTGDTITANYDPQSGVLFLLNSTKEIGRISDLEFAKKFLEIWLGEKTSAPELRGKLLGKSK